MDNASRMAKVDAVDELEHDEAYLVLSDRVLILREIFFKIVLRILKHQMQLLLTGGIDDVHKTESLKEYFTMFGWGFSYLRMEISRIAVEGTPSS